MVNKSRKASVLTSSAAMFRIICCSRDGEISGQISNVYFNDPIPFSGLGSMLLAVDDMCEALQYPQAETQARFLEEGTVRALPPVRESAAAGIPEHNPYEWIRRNGTARHPFEGMKDPRENLVFLLHVVFRQQSSMQGVLVCKDALQNKVCFRSGLELIRMMDEFLRHTENRKTEFTGDEETTYDESGTD